MRRHAKALAAAIGIGIWLTWTIAPQAGLAKIRCQRDAAHAVLSISVTNETFAGIRRVGDGIRVFDLIEPEKECATGATVTDTDQIKVFAGMNASASIELLNGPFAPGAGVEDDASPEIEFVASGPGFVEVIGGRGPDHFRYMDSGADSGVNLNPDEDDDLDFVVAREVRDEMLFVVSGGAGADRIDALGAPALEMFATGGEGRDTLVAAPTGSILDGERGSDRLIGGPDVDFLVPGQGSDRVLGRSGWDLVEMSPDRRRDVINCGPGDDFASRGDPFDRLISCN